MSILVFDTETTGLPDWGQPSDSPQQPHLVQLAMLLLDEEFNERASVSVIIRPDGWTIPEEVTKIHGITTEKAMDLGVPEKVATELYVGMLHAAGLRTRLAVGHNVKFDLRIMRIAMLRAGFDKDWQEARKPETFCTMESSIKLVNLPPTEKMVRAGFTNPKPPKLSECIKHFFGEDLEGAHDALVDVRACVRIYRHLMEVRQPASVEPVGDVV